MKIKSRAANGKTYIPCLEVLEPRLVLDDSSAGFLGVNSRFLTTPGGSLLDGSGSKIGMVEFGRPSSRHTAVVPTAEYLVENLLAPGDARAITGHALGVAGIMIANGTSDKGISSRAALYAGAGPIVNSVIAAVGVKLTADNLIFATQKVAGNLGISAINHSYVETTMRRNANSHLSAALDWLRVCNLLTSLF